MTKTIFMNMEAERRTAVGIRVEEDASDAAGDFVDVVRRELAVQCDRTSA